MNSQSATMMVTSRVRIFASYYNACFVKGCTHIKGFVDEKLEVDL